MFKDSEREGKEEKERRCEKGKRLGIMRYAQIVMGLKDSGKVNNYNYN